MNWRNVLIWLKGLLAAIIGGGANAITVMIIDPQAFNLTTGLEKLLTFATVSAILSAAFYLKASPIPDFVWDKGTVTKIILVFFLATGLLFTTSAMTCSKNGGTTQVKTIAQMTPMEKDIVFMKTYNSIYNDYVVQVATGNMSEKQKETLRNTKAVLMKAWPIIDSYHKSVIGGMPINSTWEPLIMGFLNQLGAKLQ